MGDIKSQAMWLHLEAFGFIEFSDDQERVRLTEKGRGYAAELLQRLPLDQRILVGLYGADFGRNYAVNKQ